MAAILEATVKDLPEILALQKLAYQSEAEIYGDFSIPPLTQTLESLGEDFARQVMLKAVDEGGGIVGSVRAHEKDGTCFIGRVFVHPDAQNRGLGTRLMAELEARFPGAKRFELFTGEKSLRNLHFYQKLGYRPFKREFVHDGLAFIYLEKHRPVERRNESGGERDD